MYYTIVHIFKEYVRIHRHKTSTSERVCWESNGGSGNEKNYVKTKQKWYIAYTNTEDSSELNSACKVQFKTKKIGELAYGHIPN